MGSLTQQTKAFFIRVRFWKPVSALKIDIFYSIKFDSFVFRCKPDQLNALSKKLDAMNVEF